MRSIALICVVAAAGCGPQEAAASLSRDDVPPSALEALGGLFVDQLVVDGDGTLIALAVQSHEGPCLETPVGPGCEATALALRWSTAGWQLVESEPTSWEACEAAGVSTLETAQRLLGVSE